MDFKLKDSDVNQSAPLIYLWEIEDKSGEIVRYVGKAKEGAHRPLRHYTRNVNNILNNKPYRKNKPDGFRGVHYRLAIAVKKGETISLSFICNIKPNENINEVERQWQDHYRANKFDSAILQSIFLDTQATKK